MFGIWVISCRSEGGRVRNAAAAHKLDWVVTLLQFPDNPPFISRFILEVHLSSMYTQKKTVEKNCKKKGFGSQLVARLNPAEQDRIW